MNNNKYMVIVAGGSGTRLWPMSREKSPKQFQKIISEKSLLQETYERIKDLVPKENIYISLGPSIVEETAKQLPQIPKENFIIEPESKNTGPAFALIAAKIFKKDPQAIIASIWSDNIVKKNTEYQSVINQAFSFINKYPEYLLTVGIKPESPHTGYGYIKMDQKIEGSIYYVEKFVEKPSIETAQQYVDSGKYLWNTGFFVFRADQMIRNFENHSPEINKGLRNILLGLQTKDEEEIVKKAFSDFPKTPIEIAVIEKLDKVAVIPADLGWSDVGSWASVFELLFSGKEENIRRGHHVGVGDKNCLFFAENKLLATVGLEDIIVVDTPDVTLICNKNKSQEVKNLIEKLKEEGKSNYL